MDFMVSTLVSGKSIGQKEVLPKGTFGLYVTTDGMLFIPFFDLACSADTR
jgi:hypothetical protein